MKNKLLVVKRTLSINTCIFSPEINVGDGVTFRSNINPGMKV